MVYGRDQCVTIPHINGRRRVRVRAVRRARDGIEFTGVDRGGAAGRLRNTIYRIIVSVCRCGIICTGLREPIFVIPGKVEVP